MALSFLKQKEYIVVCWNFQAEGIEFWKHIHIIRESQDVRLRRSAVKWLRAYVPNPERLLALINPSFTQGTAAIWAKANSSILFGHPDYEANEAARFIGCCPTRLTKFQHDRFLREVLSMGIVFRLIDFLNLGLYQCEEMMTRPQHSFAGLSGAVPRFIWEQNKNRSHPFVTGRLPRFSIQASILATKVVYHSKVDLMTMVDWKERGRAAQIVASHPELASVLWDLTEAVNDEIRAVPRLAVAIDVLKYESIIECLAETAPWWREWILCCELLYPSLEEGSGIPLLGVFDPFSGGGRAGPIAN